MASSPYPNVASREIERDEYYIRKFQSLEYFKAFLEGQNPHLVPEQKRVFSPSSLREIARYIHIRNNILDYIGNRRDEDIEDFFSGIKGQSLNDSSNFELVAYRATNPRIYLPDTHNMFSSAKRDLVTEIYSFIDSNMARAQLALPRTDEVLSDILEIRNSRESSLQNRTSWITPYDFDGDPDSDGEIDF